MHDIVQFLKACVDRSEHAGIYSCFIVRDGCIYSRNVGLQAGIPMESAEPFNIPAGELERALGRMKNVDTIRIRDGAVRIKSGNKSVTIKINTTEAQSMPPMPPDDEWTPAPKGLSWAVKTALPFIGDEGYTASVQLRNGQVGAISSFRGVAIPLKGLKLSQPMAISKEVAAFLGEQGDPDWYYQEPSAFMVRWDDGRWARAQLYAYEVPDDRIDALFASAGDEAPVIMDAAWREAYEDAVALSSSGIVMLAPEGLHVQNDVTSGIVKHETKGLPAGHKTYWDSKVLAPVVACAERWNPASYPKPAVFFGPGNLKGMVMGRSRF